MIFTTLLAALSATAAIAAPVPNLRREVPQEHSHEATLRAVNVLLQLNNPDGIVDAVFGLLGAAAAADGAGNIADPDCLQQATADQAFTNAKAAGDIQGMTDALIFRALERNTGQVGLKSVLCESIQAVNPEIAAITQHQDPASDNAAAENKAIVLELARQIASIGGDPLAALDSGTFEPGQIGDPTAAGNTCNDAEDANGCIFTLGLIVLDASEDEILAAVADIIGADAVVGDVEAVDAVDAIAGCPDVVTVTVTLNASGAVSTAVAAAPVAAPVAAAPVAAAPVVENAAAGANLQAFSGALGGIDAPTVSAGGRGFVVENNADFLNIGAALNRSCDVQHNQCANAANAGGVDFSVSDCGAQLAECKAAASGASA